MLKIVHEWLFFAWAILKMTGMGAKLRFSIAAMWILYRDVLAERKEGQDTWLYEYDIPSKEDLQ